MSANFGRSAGASYRHDWCAPLQAAPLSGCYDFELGEDFAELEKLFLIGTVPEQPPSVGTTPIPSAPPAKRPTLSNSSVDNAAMFRAGPLPCLVAAQEEEQPQWQQLQQPLTRALLEPAGGCTALSVAVQAVPTACRVGQAAAACAPQQPLLSAVGSSGVQGPSSTVGPSHQGTGASAPMQQQEQQQKEQEQQQLGGEEPALAAHHRRMALLARYWRSKLPPPPQQQQLSAAQQQQRWRQQQFSQGPSSPVSPLDSQEGEQGANGLPAPSSFGSQGTEPSSVAAGQQAKHCRLKSTEHPWLGSAGQGQQQREQQQLRHQPATPSDAPALPWLARIPSVDSLPPSPSQQALELPQQQQNQQQAQAWLEQAQQPAWQSHPQQPGAPSAQLRSGPPPPEGAQVSLPLWPPRQAAGQPGPAHGVVPQRRQQQQQEGAGSGQIAGPRPAQDLQQRASQLALAAQQRDRGLPTVVLASLGGAAGSGACGDPGPPGAGLACPPPSKRSRLALPAEQPPPPPAVRASHPGAPQAGTLRPVHTGTGGQGWQLAAPEPGGPSLAPSAPWVPARQGPGLAQQPGMSQPQAQAQAGRKGAITVPAAVPAAFGRQASSKNSQEPQTVQAQRNCGAARRQQDPRESSRQASRRARARQKERVAKLEEENELLRREAQHLRCTLRLWLSQGYVTPEQALEFFDPSLFEAEGLGQH